MTVDKITNAPTPNEQIDKINEIIDNLSSSSITVDSALSTTSTNPVQNKVVTVALNGKQGTISDLSTIRSGASAGATAVQPGDLANVATSGNYNDLSNKPTIPTVNNATLTIQKNGTTVKKFTANASSNVTANITVPTKTSELTNDSGYTTNTGTVTSVNNVAPVNGNVTLSIPDAQVQSNWTETNTSSKAYIKNKPNLASVATSGSYNDLTNKPTIPSVGNATITITQGGATKGSFTTNQSGNATIALDSGSQGASRNIGEIIQSTIPLTDAGLHLLDGSTIFNAGIYEDFFTKIQQLYNSGNYDYLFTTASDWQTSVATYGVCGKFVYSAGLQSLRLPKITGFTEGTTDVTTLGDLTEAGLPNIEGRIYVKTSSGGTASGAFTFSSENTGVTPSGTNKDKNVDANFNASLSNPIYGNSTTVQPQSIKVLYYIVVANSTKTEIEVDIDEIATDLNGKADSDLSNVPTSKGILTDSYISGSSWYRVYADGWCEQGGIATGGNNGTGVLVSLLKNYTNTNYTLVTGGISRQSEVFPNNGVLAVKIRNISVSGFYATTNWVTASTAGYINYEFSWCAYGYIR